MGDSALTSSHVNSLKMSYSSVPLVNQSFVVLTLNDSAVLSYALATLSIIALARTG
jgi:hypothetical protein